MYGQWFFRLSVLRIRETTKENLSATPFELIALLISHYCLSHLRDETEQIVVISLNLDFIFSVADRHDANADEMQSFPEKEYVL